MAGSGDEHNDWSPAHGIKPMAMYLCILKLMECVGSLKELSCLLNSGLVFEMRASFNLLATRK